jgi:pimeloyl-ACP methyl ester carboxylesterase
MLGRFSRFVIVVVTALTAAMPARAAPDPAVTYANQHAADGNTYREGYFGSGDTRLHYVEVGRGPLIILYHGFPSYWFSFFDQMEELKTRYRVVAVDGLGAGLSAKPVEPALYRIDRLAAQLDGLARHLNGGKRFALVGHDWGAALAFAYAQGYPDRLTAVVGLSAPPYNLFLDLVSQDPEQQRRSAYMERFQKLTLADLQRPGFTERFWQGAYGNLIATGDLTVAEGELFRQALADPLAVNGGMNWYRANLTAFAKLDETWRWPIDNPKINAPALLIWGDADQTFVGAAAIRMPDYANRGTVVHLPGINHWATMERPELANRAIGDFLAKHHPAQRARK